ncbi:hypothetical protein DRP07_05640 [Archaeoglobales archaeon]|nr:MAG: hypothetical protein DRP07_05640 [Archaeoglobales archaeon]
MVFIDTTFLMPFFHLDVDVDGFSREIFREKLSHFKLIHASEISIIEIKAKIVRMKSTRIKKIFRENLSILRDDDRFVFHGYTADDDVRFEEIEQLDLNYIVGLIVSQAFNVGLLLTEDGKILKEKGSLKKLGLDVVSWNEFVKLQK